MEQGHEQSRVVRAARDAGRISEDRERLNRLSGEAVDAAIGIHRKLGPGLMEYVSESILAQDLVRRGIYVERQKSISFDYEGLWFADACRADLVLETLLVIEVKATERVTPVHRRQLMTYLRLLDCRLGVVLNFGAAFMKDGIVRVVNGF